MIKKFLDGYLLLAPTTRTIIEWGILIGSGLLGMIFSWTKLPFVPVINIIGIILFSSGLLFHCLAERTHRQAHQQADLIRQIITTGIYAKIRHPLYLSVIIMNIGIAFIFGNVWSLIIAGLISILTIMTIYKEEAFLQKKFVPEYQEYMREVPWRMIPRIF